MSKPNTVDVAHPETGDVSQVTLPLDHDGSRVKVEFADGAIAYTDGWDPAQRALAGERPVVPCGKCGAAQTLTSRVFDCSACGARNTIELQASVDSGAASTDEG